MTDELWAMEEGWWTMGAAEARRRMHPSCVMVFAPGILQGEEILAALDQGPRWDDVRMTDRRTLETGALAVLAYRATARRGGTDHVALCCSTWMQGDEGWQLIQHQQTAPQDGQAQGDDPAGASGHAEGGGIAGD